MTYPRLHKAQAPWTSGAARMYLKDEGGRGDLVVGVRCKLGGMLDEMALLDTGAEWSVISAETAQILGDQLEKLEGGISYKTRFGPKQGLFHRLCVDLLADPGCGEDLQCEATIVVIDGWEGPTVLGFRGLMEHLRIGLDPDDRDSFFHFGSAQG